MKDKIEIIKGDITKQAGSIGGYMVKRLIEQAERQMANK